MTAQLVEAAPHGTYAGYSWHYRRRIPVCKECLSAAMAYQRQQRRDARIKVVPYGWPCPDCTWTARLGTPDGRVISWRIERCPKHRRAW